MDPRRFLQASRTQSKLFAVAHGLRDDDKVCRLCHGEELFSDMVVPCDCSGSMKWAHRSCLEEMVRNSENNNSCTVCGRFYTMVSKSPVVALLLWYTDCISRYGAFIGFPLAWWNNDWPWMMIWASVPSFKIVLESPLFLPVDTLMITTKMSDLSCVFGNVYHVIATFNLSALFLLYCNSLRWSIDFQRLWPATASLVVSQFIAFGLGGSVCAFFGINDEMDTDDIYTYCFLLGLGLWSVIRADPMIDGASAILLPNPSELLSLSEAPVGNSVSSMQCKVRPVWS